MSERPETRPVREEEIAAFADGSLSPARRELVEAAIAANPEWQERLREQHQARTAIIAATGYIEAPHSLRERLAATQTVSAAPPPKRRFGWILSGVGALGLLVFVMVAMFMPGRFSAISVASAADAARNAPTDPAPGPGGDKILALAVDGVAFPDYAEKFGWKAVGTRADTLGGRTVRTVTYERGGQRVGYAIVPGKALPVPSDGTTVTQEGTPVTVLTIKGKKTVTWQRKGHTCVMVGDGVPDSTLVELAAWKGKGKVAF